MGQNVTEYHSKDYSDLVEMLIDTQQLFFVLVVNIYILNDNYFCHSGQGLVFQKGYYVIQVKGWDFKRVLMLFGARVGFLKRVLTLFGSRVVFFQITKQ